MSLVIEKHFSAAVKPEGSRPAAVMFYSLLSISTYFPNHPLSVAVQFS